MRKCIEAEEADKMLKALQRKGVGTATVEQFSLSVEGKKQAKVSGESILYLSSSKARLWFVFTLFSLFLLAHHCVQFKKQKGKLAWSLESCI